MQSKSFAKPILIVFGALVAIGVACWIYQLATGLAVTGMSNINSWGLYICLFMLFVDLSAGGLIVASSAHVFGIESFKSVAKPAVICSTACICVAGMFVLVDLGGIARAWYTAIMAPIFVASALASSLCKSFADLSPSVLFVD